MNYLAIQTTYLQLQIGLFENQKLLDTLCADKKIASKTIITHIQTLLNSNNRALSDLSFIAVNQGPAPFTSLRVVIATVNGLSFGSSIPLVGVDGLAAFMQEYQNSAWPYTIALLNAFNQDAYYALQTPLLFEKGCINIDTLLAKLKKITNTQPVRFIGSGTELFADQILQHFGPLASIPEPLPEYPSIEQIASCALNQWKNKKNITDQILPLYLKQLRYKKSISS